jgi:hypothetical protein
MAEFVVPTRILLTLYEVNPGRNHKFWHIGSTALYEVNPGRNHKFWLRQNLWFLPGFT